MVQYHVVPSLAHWPYSTAGAPYQWLFAASKG